MGKEGVVKYRPIFVNGKGIDYHEIEDLNKWRQILRKKGLLGNSDGVDFGNVGKNLIQSGLENGSHFLAVTESQTGHKKELTLRNYPVVTSYCPEENVATIIKSQFGEIMPTSELPSYFAFLSADPNIRFIYHGHNRKMWENAERLNIPMTSKDAEYGSPKLHYDISVRFPDIKDIGILGMGGHKDGIFTWGDNADEAGNRMLRFLDRANQLR